MISYLLLHYNRPYLLDTNIRILRKYLPVGSQIVVADDGSHPDVIKKIHQFAIDDLFVQKENKNAWVEGTCSNTIVAGRKLLKNKYVVFSEDDFFFCPNPVDDKGFAQWEIMPEVFYKSDAPCTFFEESQKLLSEKKAKNVQMARDDCGWRAVPVNGEFTTDNYKWKYIDHIKKNRFYYSNWPSMMRTASYRDIPMSANKAIWNFEGSFSKSVDGHFGKSNWAVVPECRRYIHVGMPFSKRLNSFANSAKKRSAVVQSLQTMLYDKVTITDIETFNRVLLNLWLEGRFFIDFDEMMETGLQSAFYKAFERVTKQICA